jgi:hypothetical protein
MASPPLKRTKSGRDKARRDEARRTVDWPFTLLLLCHNYSLCVRIGKIEWLRAPLKAAIVGPDLTALQ